MSFRSRLQAAFILAPSTLTSFICPLKSRFIKAWSSALNSLPGLPISRSRLAGLFRGRFGKRLGIKHSKHYAREPKLEHLLKERVLFSLAVLVSLLVMIIAKSAMGCLGLVALIGLKMVGGDVLTYLEKLNKLSELERVERLESEVRSIANAMTFKTMK